MFDFINKVLKSFLGSKSDRDLKDLLPHVGKINAVFDTFSGFSNDELRAKTTEFRERINGHIQEIENEIAELNNSSEANPDMDLHEKEELFGRIDDLKKEPSGGLCRSERNGATLHATRVAGSDCARA
jgi:preprotein translocase subunit SecA